MKRTVIFSLATLLTFVWIVGCASMPSPKKMITRSKKPAKSGLYAQTPAAVRAPVKEASFDLKQSLANLRLAEEKVKLAGLKKERAEMEEKYSQTNKKLADTLVKQNEIIVERRKMEAVDNANLGDKEANIKRIADLKSKELSVESDSIQIKAEMSTLALRIKQLDKKIKAQNKRIAGKTKGKKRKGRKRG